MKRVVLALLSLCVLLCHSPASYAQQPSLQPLSVDERAALEPLANSGAALLVRDPDAGVNARITVLLKARAPVSVVRSVIATPQNYPSFMPTLHSVEVLSSRANRTAFRFRVSAMLFDVVTLSALHVVNPHRIDVSIVQSDLGPGASRWDLFPAQEQGQDITWIAVTSWGDPSQGHWFLRQVAGRSPAAVAAMTMSTNLLLALAVRRHSEITAGLQLPQRPTVFSVNNANFVPPRHDTWTRLLSNAVVGQVVLNPDGTLLQTSIAARSGRTLQELQQRFTDPSGYTQIWRAMRQVTVVQSVADRVRFRVVAESAGARTDGEIERRIEVSPTGVTPPWVRVFWQGISGNYLGFDHQWDMWADPVAGTTLLPTVVMLTGGAELPRINWAIRRLIDQDGWLLVGFAASWKMIWMRPVL